MIADLDMKVSELYGMVHPGASTTATVRTIVYYPMNVGRNVDEIKRIVEALPTADAFACATPVNWVPGQKVVAPPPKTTAEVAERESHRGKDYDVKDFYLSLKDAPKK